MNNIDDKLKNFRKELIKAEDQDAVFTRWFRERVVVWTIILLVIIFTVMWGAEPVEAQETGPVNEGEWVVPSDAIIVCPFFVNEVDPNVCSFIEDKWGPYPNEDRCNARIDQMAILFTEILLSLSGIPHWSIINNQCSIPEPEGVDA